jgi:triphosphoribosyl-dephospho-CoA synthase
MNGATGAVSLAEEICLSVGHCAELACILEATARKAGNVTRFADFEDLSYLDLVLSASVIRPILDRATPRTVGLTVLYAVRATRQVCRSNSNLGIILLFSPLAAAEEPARVGTVLRQLTVDDSRAVFEAIRLARPSGLGEVPDQDVWQEPTLPLPEVMALAADRDLIARQYVNDFDDVFQIGVPTLLESPRRCVLPPLLGSPPDELVPGFEEAIVQCHLRLLAELGDSHIARRCGQVVSDEARQRAAEVLAGRLSWAEFDAWLRSESPRRNPGSTADLTAAALFVAIRSGKIEFPLQFESSCTGCKNR